MRYYGGIEVREEVRKSIETNIEATMAEKSCHRDYKCRAQGSQREQECRTKEDHGGTKPKIRTKKLKSRLKR